MADFFGCKNPEQVVFTQNCTHALNLAIKGILRVGDHAIISDIEHNSVLRPIHTLKERGAIAYDIAPIDLSDDVTVENFRRLIKPNTKLIAVSHGSNVFGTVSYTHLDVYKRQAICERQLFYTKEKIVPKAKLSISSNVPSKG